MINLFFKNKFLVGVIILAALLRLWGLSINPPHLTNDEAALGYNAYSILKTARDEHGEFLPIVFKSFGDWKPGLYVYLTVPSVAAFGLNEFAVRFPNAIAGILSVFLIYLVVKELFGSRKVALASSFFLAISPWHIHFTRGAWEAGFSLTLVLLGVYFFLRSIRDKPNWLALSAFFLSLTLWAYQGAKLSTAIVLLGLVLVFYKKLLNIPRRNILQSVIVGILVTIPVVFTLFEGKVGRLEVYSIFSYGRSNEIVQEIISQGGVVRDSVQYFVFHSEPLNFLRGILGRWANHYSGRFLFFEGDWANSRHGVPNNGVILLLDALFLVAGFIALSRQGKQKPALFVWFWLVFATLPAALSRDAIHAIRSLNMVIPLTIILALGSVFLWEKRRVFGSFVKPVIFIFVFLYITNFVYFLDQYWRHSPSANSKDWQYGYKQIVESIGPIQSQYNKIIVRQDYSQPYIFFLFYQKYDPERYQKIAGDVFIPNKSGDVGLVSNLDNITFRGINWSADREMSGTLLVLDSIEVPVKDSSDPEKFKLVDEIKYLDGFSAFRLLEIR